MSLELGDWFAGLAVGDEVVITSRHTSRIARVSGISGKKRRVVEVGLGRMIYKFTSPDRCSSNSNEYNWYYIRGVTPELRRKIDEEARHQRALGYLSRVRWDGVPAELVIEIAELVSRKITDHYNKSSPQPNTSPLFVGNAKSHGILNTGES